MQMESLRLTAVDLFFFFFFFLQHLPQQYKYWCDGNCCGLGGPDDPNEDIRAVEEGRLGRKPRRGHRQCRQQGRTVEGGLYGSGHSSRVCDAAGVGATPEPPLEKGGSCNFVCIVV